MRANNFLIILSIFFTFSFSFSQGMKFKPSKDMVSVNGIQGDYTIKVGQKVYYSGHVHGSVGEAYRIWSDDPLILSQFKTHFAYHKNQKTAGNGGDAATSTFVFKALKIGKTTLTVEEKFRGKVTKRYQIKIEVVD